MVRGKIQMKRIENASSRQITFSKRKNGLLKKAQELSVLCEAEVAVILFSQKGRLFEFSSSDIQKTIDRYRKSSGDWQSENANKISIEQAISEEARSFFRCRHDTIEQRKLEIAAMARQMEQIEDSKRKLMGHGLETCSHEELQKIEEGLDRSLSSIRKRKAQLFMEKIEQLKAKERLLLEENASLSAQCGMEARTGNKQAEIYCSQSSQSSDAEETQLFIEFRCL